MKDPTKPHDAEDVDPRASRRREADDTFRVEDRRHSAHDTADDEERGPEPSPRAPTLVDEYRMRTEAAEQKLQEYIEAFKHFRREQDEFRERLGRDVERRVELKFGSLVQELFEALDNLDLALEHVAQVPEAAPLAQGIALASKRILEALERQGVERVFPSGEFDPNEAEAVRVDPVATRELAGAVTEVLRPGYRLGERVIRPARVAVGRYER